MALIVHKVPDEMAVTFETRKALLDYVRHMWQNTEPQLRPDRVLVREYASVPEDGQWEGRAWPERFWILDREGYHEQCTVQSQRLQAIEQLVPGGNTLKTGTGGIPTYESGSIVFAPFAEPGEFYLHRIFGPRSGSGSRVRVDEQGSVIWMQRLWIT